MGRNIEDNNEVYLIGEVIRGFDLSHEVYEEKFYSLLLETERRSQNTDCIPALVSERLIDVSQDYIGRHMKIIGEYRSYNQHQQDGKSKLILSVFANSIEVCTEYEDDVDVIAISGYICKAPVYRETPLGREIADILVAVNRQYGKSDYIPCICWGRNAKYAASFKAGNNVEILGRIQSREYKKDDLIKTAYEVSVRSVNKIEKENP